MKRLITSAFLIGISIQLFGQLNPINDLLFEHWYSYNSGCPSFNCFSLSWEEPNASSDTLIGYNIYRDSELWRFQDYINAGCSEIIAPPCPDADFFDYPAPFWIKVKAVYNSAQEESIVIDSVQFMGLMMGLEKSQIENEKLYPNPTNGIINVDIKNISKVIILNSSGMEIQELADKSFIDLSKHSKGIYYIKIITDSEITIKKIVLK